MRTLFRVFLFVALVAIIIAAGFGTVSRHDRGSYNVLTSSASAHVGGQCYLDDTNLQAIENKCYSKCLRSYHERATQDACQVGCSTAISVATRK
ncbi:MAG TPA: hypothetical protein PKM08_08905 [Syntrophorhabdaceae bacterium]|nr:hypothetical protein [Syntrophorhabdaceae bacterium]HNT70003.1 hypothetical protein [Syntrophorhabdaceae bacterium]